MAPLAKVPKVQSVTVAAFEQDVGIDTVLDHVWSTPLAGDHRVVAQMPPEVIGQLLRSSIDLPFPENIEALGVHDEDASRTLPIGRSQCASVDPVGSAMYGVRCGVAGSRSEFLRLDH